MRLHSTLLTAVLDEFELPNGATLGSIPLCGTPPPFDVDYSYLRGAPAVHTLPNGDPGYPAEADELEIHKISARTPLMWQGEGIAVATCAGADLRALIPARFRDALEAQLACQAERELDQMRAEQLFDRAQRQIDQLQDAGTQTAGVRPFPF